MALVGYVANSTGSTASLNIRDILATQYGHTVTLSTQAAFASGTFSAQDVIVVGPSDRNDIPGFIADLDTHMTTHGVPVIVLASDGLAAGAIGRNGTDAPDTTASALGIIALERRNAAATPAADFAALRSQSKENLITDAFGKLPAEADIMLHEDAGAIVTEIADPIDFGTVREISGNAAGTRLLNNGDGFTMLVAADSGDAKIGSRVGSTFDERVVWFGISGAARIGKDAASMLNSAIAWVQDNAAANDFPTSGTNGAVFIGIDLAALVEYESGLISWTAVTPAGTTVTVAVSDDDGATFSAQTNGAAIPVLSDGDNVLTTQLLIKVTLASTIVGNTPTFSGLNVVLRGAFAPMRDSSDVIRAADYFLGGQVIWNTGLNSGTSMEIREWTPGTRTIRLWLPMPLNIVAGDSFKIRPGCLKRFDLDCVLKFSNGVNHRGEPHIPGTDQVTTFPDAQG